MISVITVFIFGLIIGSFLNALIWRLHTGESILRGRSYCPKCKHVLAVKDLIPIVSFIVQKGKCRYCGQKISWQYPAVELVTAILFVIAYLISDFRFPISDWVSDFRFPISDWFLGSLIFQFFGLLKIWFFIAVMIVIFVYDLKYSLILDKVVYPAAVIAFLTSPLISKQEWWHNAIEASIAGVIAGGFFLVQYLISKGKWIGGGDVKMGFLMGLILGVKGILVALFFAYVIGALVSLILVAAKKKTMKSTIPFGTFLAIGTIIAMFWGEKILQLYLSGVHKF